MTYSWPWIFLINVPVGILTAFLVARLVEDPPWQKRAEANARRGTDYVGLALIALGIGCLQVMVDRGEDADWFGSIAISLATATVTNRTQVRLATLQPFASAQREGFDHALHRYAAELHALGHVGGAAQQTALGLLHQTWETQAAILAYGDLFSHTAPLSFAIVPPYLLFGARSGGGMPGG